MTTEITVSTQATTDIILASERLDQNPAAVYLASLGSAQSRRTMRTALNTIASLLTNGDATVETFPWGALRFQHTQAVRAALSEKYAPATANKMLSALRGVVGKAYKLGYLTPDEYAKASDIAGVKGTSPVAGRELDGGELASLARVCREDKTVAGARDKAMIGILYACGLRRAELVALDLDDYDAESGKLTVRSGKGRKARTVYATNGAQDALDAWINQRGQEAGPLFTAIGKGAKLTARRMTTQAVYFILAKRAEEAGVKAFSPHDLRRTFVSDMLDRGADIATVAKLAGHASVTTTARYDRRQEETKRKAAGLLHFPD